MSSPRKKKAKLSKSPEPGTKRELGGNERASKRQKTEKVDPKPDLQAQKRKNFIKACEIVSFKTYFDQKLKFQMDCSPACAIAGPCKHQDNKHGTNIKVMPPYKEESLKIEMKSNMWREALEVCRLCITPRQYLSANVLKDIVEIMLNAHDDDYADYTIEYLIEKCQQIFELNFSYHPPCLVKSLRECYNDFLTSPMDRKENTFTNRSQFGYDKGVAKYCLNRLEYEITLGSKDGPLVDKYENIPEDMKQSVKGLHWQKEKFEIYELLERTERIERLIAVLDSIIELLQCDLAIWHSRYTNNLGCHIMRSYKPLMAFLLWSNDVLCTGAVNNNCRQILRIFVHLIHLQYPEDHIKTMTIWLNTMIQTFYICESNSNSDYPNIGKYCTAFAKEFYKIISDMPEKSVIRILERIKPDYMRSLIGTLHIKRILSTVESDPIKQFKEFVEEKKWKGFFESPSEIIILRKSHINIKNLKNFTNYVMKKCESLKTVKTVTTEECDRLYPKFDPQSIVKNESWLLNHILHTFYITIEAYLDAYNVQNVQETLESMNEKLNSGDAAEEENQMTEFSSYSVTENVIKKYRSIYQTLKELMILLQGLKNSGELPKIFKVFEKIGLLRM